MAVKVDDRIFRARHRMLRHDERRSRLVVDDAGRWELGLALGAWPIADRPLALRALRCLGNAQRGGRGDCQRQNEDSAEHVKLYVGIWALGFGIWVLGFQSVAAAR